MVTSARIPICEPTSQPQAAWAPEEISREDIKQSHLDGDLCQCQEWHKQYNTGKCGLRLAL